MKKFIGGVIVGAIFIGLIWCLVSYGNGKNNRGMNMMESMGMRNMIAPKANSLTKLEDESVPTVKPTEIITLNDGDSFDLEATIVKQEVGNRVVKRLAYNGQIPGPVIKVKKGAKVTVNFTNNIDMETSLHSHGLRGQWEFDGAVPITPAVKVGETFSYQLEFPDTGVFWYHPHVREDYQQEMGLYGNMVVEENNYWNEADKEAYLIVDDFLEDGDFSKNTITKTLMGRFGDILMINDKQDYNLIVNQGEINRLFITNVANTRTFDLKFDKAFTKLVGGDIGRIEKEQMIESQIIAPAERYVLEVYYDTPGTYPILHRGKKIGSVTVNPSDKNNFAKFKILRENLTDYADIRANIKEFINRKADKNIRLDIEMRKGGKMMGMMKDDADKHERNHNDNNHHDNNKMEMMGGNMDMESDTHDAGDGIEWEDDMAMMNNMSNSEMMRWIIEDTDTEKINEDIKWNFKQGDLVKVKIYNDEKGMHPMQHPIHFHGQRFLVLSTDGVVNDNLQWKDTVLIPAGRTIEILVDMSNPGKWMAHCHIAEHLHAGMMFRFDVE